MTNQQNIGNNSRAEIPLSERVYAFNDLPKDVREKLLQMQNTDGVFLKRGSGETARRIIFLVLLAMAFIGLTAIVTDDVNEGILDLKRIFVFSADALVLLIWFVYFVWRISKTVGSPLKTLIYLTPTQAIETLDGFVRYRELRNAAEISVNKFWTDLGRRFTLDIKFDDGDSYQYYIAKVSYSEQLSATQKLQEKAMGWKKEAITAFERGDAAYFDSHDVFSKLSETDMPVLQIPPPHRTENVLLIMTIALIALNGVFIHFLSA